MFKEQKGITLIALVITIIVLLILAGVTIAMLSGNDSTPAKANAAANRDAVAAAKDKVAMTAMDALTDYYNSTYVVNGSSTAGTGARAAIEAKFADDSTEGNAKINKVNSSHEIKVESTKDSSVYATATIDDKGGITWVNHFE